MSDLLDYLLAHHWHGLVGTPCACGSLDTSGGHRMRSVGCNNCRQYAVSCEVCWLKAHKNAPTHWPQVWDYQARYFVPHDICHLRDEHDVCASVNLGHGGDACPHATSTVEFTIVDLNGVHSTRMRFCVCINAGDRVAQLMKAGFFPATVREPSTVFSFDVMKDFHMHHLESKKAAYDYIGAIVRLTDNVFTADVQSPYEAFHRAAQVWSVLTARKRTGEGLGIGQFMAHRPRGNLRVFCSACPQPGFVQLPGSDRVPHHLRHINQMGWTLDGNHHLNKYEKARRSDPDSVSLWNGSGYIPHDPTYRAKMQAVNAARGHEQKIDGDCDYLKAAQKQKFAKFKGLEVTGVVNCQCEHVFILSSVDMHAGERTCYSDSAIANAIAMYVPEGSNIPEQVLRGIDNIASYDMACITTVNLVNRFREDYPDLVPVVEKMRWGIPAVHCPNHKEQCWFEFGTGYLECWCHFFGETAEHYWAEANQIGNFTRQMNAGHRHDVLNDHHGDWNWKKTIRLPAQLLSDLQTSSALYESKRTAFLNLTITYGKQRTDGWNALSRSFRRHPDKSFESVYRHKTKKLPSKDAVYQALVQDELRRAEKGLRPIEGPVSVSVLDEGLKIRDAQYVAGPFMALPNRDHTKSYERELASRRSKLIVRISKWRRQQLEIMPCVARKLEATADSDTDTPVEHETLWLPSDFDHEERTTLGLTELASHESRLLEGECHDAIEAIKACTRQLDVMRRYQKDRARGQEQNSRALTELYTAERAQEQHLLHYAEARAGLIALGFMSADDPDTEFPELTKADTYRKATEDGRNIGDSRREDGSLWARAGLRTGPVHGCTISNSHDSEQPSTALKVATKATPQPKAGNNCRARKLSSNSRWLWLPKSGGKMSEDEMKAWIDEGDRVQWFRAEAEMMRFREQLEKREIEFLRVIESHTKTGNVWRKLAEQQKLPGQAAYARRQAAMWHRMADDATKKLRKAGYGLLADGEDIVGRIESRRAAQDQYMKTYLAQSRVSA
ncbi:hypothetical protein PENSPDRAFT_719810 [Peniophora sp. CONT]|nr:hypothetical protein PENSPDRAFT_719810 [Peniophora sp. CONT]